MPLADQPPPAAASAPATPQPGNGGLLSSLPPEAREFVRVHPEIGTVLALCAAFSRPLLFLFLFLFLLVGLLFSALVRRALAPGVEASSDRQTATEQLGRRSAMWSILVWAMALLIASESVGVTWGGQVVRLVVDVLAGLTQLAGRLLGFAGTATIGAAIILAAGLVVYSVAPGGRDLVLSVIGWYYLAHSPRKPASGQVFDLGDGKSGTIDHVDLLHTTFAVQDGTLETRPNCFLMKAYFNWRTAADE